MSEQPTLGKWSVVPFICCGSRIGIQDENGKWVGEEGTREIGLIPRFDAEHARRIVACVNACDGLDTELLENIIMMGDTLASRFTLRDETERELQAQRDELLEVCKMLESAGSLAEVDRAYMMKKIYFANLAAIAKAEGRS